MRHFVVLLEQSRGLSPILYFGAIVGAPEDVPGSPHKQFMPQPDTILESAKPEAEPVNLHYDTRLPQLPWTRRIQIPFIAAAVYSVIRTLGPTLRYEVLGWQHAEKVHASGKRIIWAF